MTHSSEISYEAELWSQTRELALALPAAPNGPSLYIKHLLFGSAQEREGGTILYASTEWTDRQHTTIVFKGLAVPGDPGESQRLFDDVQEAMGEAQLYPGGQGTLVDNAPLQSPDAIRQAELARVFLPTLSLLHVKIPHSVQKPYPRSFLYEYREGADEVDPLKLERLAQANWLLGQLVQGETTYFTVGDVFPERKRAIEADSRDEPGVFSWAPQL